MGRKGENGVSGEHALRKAKDSKKDLTGASHFFAFYDSGPSLEID
jgi:hypothetical protein